MRRVDPDPANADAVRTWAVDYFDAPHPYSAGGAYVNMMNGQGPERVSQHRDNHDRPAAIKAIYVPGNLFRVSQNIPPAQQ